MRHEVLLLMGGPPTDKNLRPTFELDLLGEIMPAFANRGNYDVLPLTAARVKLNKAAVGDAVAAFEDMLHGGKHLRYLCLGLDAYAYFLNQGSRASDLRNATGKIVRGPDTLYRPLMYLPSPLSAYFDQTVEAFPSYREWNKAKMAAEFALNRLTALRATAEKYLLNGPKT